MFPSDSFRPVAGFSNFAFFTPPQQDTTLTRGWRPWTKPAGCTWIYIFAVGGGSGGAGGQSTAGAARFAGSGGGGGGMTRLIIPSLFLPEVLFIRPGHGSLGGAAATNSVAAIGSYVSIAPDNTQGLCLAMPAGGGVASASGGSAGGGGIGVTNGAQAASGFWLGVNGTVGASSGVNTGAVPIALPAMITTPFTGGAAGGSSGTGNNVFAGGSVPAVQPATGIGFQPVVNGGAAGVSGTSPGGAGQDGIGCGGLDIEQLIARSAPMIFTGGAGGGSGGASNGGKGGDAGPGCGGGGGGAGATGGAGGKGGDGFVIIGGF